MTPVNWKIAIQITDTVYILYSDNAGGKETDIMAKL